MNHILEVISEIGILPVVKINSSKQAVGLAKALCAGGIPIAEVTFRTAAAEESIRLMAEQVPEILVGAGTVLTIEQAEAAVAAGAKFLVSPGFNPTVTGWCLEHDIPIVPGCATPTEIEAALAMGLNVLKFFPAEAAGGIPMLKSLASPYGGVQFIPTGGITPESLNQYLSLSNVVACGGSWMVPEKLLDGENFAEITALCKTAVQNLLGFELLHVGINTENEQQAAVVAGAFGALFSLPLAETSGAIFAGKAVEVMKTPFLGEHGHIAFSTNDIRRAIAYFRRLGVQFDEASAIKDDKGGLIALYFKEQIGGFAVHLRRK